MNDLRLRLFHVIAQIGEDMPIAEIHEDQQLERDLGFDSFDRVSLLNEIEDEFTPMCFQPPEDRQLSAPTTTVLELLQGIERHLQKA